MIVRGCGTRVAGGIYAVNSGGTATVDEFLIDPPWVIDRQQLALSTIGVNLVEVNGVTHLIDIVGKVHYPQPVHFIEEARRHGVSRRLPSNLDWGRLSPQSRLILAHDLAYLDGWDEWYTAMGKRPSDWACITNKPAHAWAKQRPKEMCINLLWADIASDDVDPSAYTGQTRWGLNEVKMTVGQTEFTACERPVPIKPAYKLAAFMSVPFRIEVVAGGGKTPAGVFQSGKPVTAVPE